MPREGKGRRGGGGRTVRTPLHQFLPTPWYEVRIKVTNAHAYVKNKTMHFVKNVYLSL